MTPPAAQGLGGVPRAALLLGLAGVGPFAWGALTVLVPALGDWSQAVLGGRLTGRTLLLLYGTIILSFMSGTVWGFATRAGGGSGDESGSGSGSRARARADGKGRGPGAGLLYALSTGPALWALFLGFSALALALGFALLLLLDRHAQRAGLAPPWWMALRLLLTALVVPCLLVGAP